MDNSLIFHWPRILPIHHVPGHLCKSGKFTASQKVILEIERVVPSLLSYPSYIIILSIVSVLARFLSPFLSVLQSDNYTLTRANMSKPLQTTASSNVARGGILQFLVSCSTRLFRLFGLFFCILSILCIFPFVFRFFFGLFFATLLFILAFLLNSCHRWESNSVCTPEKVFCAEIYLPQPIIHTVPEVSLHLVIILCFRGLGFLFIFFFCIRLLLGAKQSQQKHHHLSFCRSVILQVFSELHKVWPSSPCPAKLHTRWQQLKSHEDFDNST